ncbi:IgA peptidase M64-domain-containing protein [Rhizoctonia solani]|nr:IgA peptidase M64-domain-containing protein [Rhizoctonia solani]
MKALLFSSLATFLYLVATHEIFNSNDKPGYELLITRDRISRYCHLSNIRSVSLHKALRYSSTHIETKPSRCAPNLKSPCQTDDVLVVSHHLETLDSVIAQECANNARGPTLVSTPPQLVLPQSRAPKLDIEALANLITGSTPNRINIVFFSDGYTVKEKQKFLDDATRLALAISVNQTYAPVAPLINFWGAFTPSKESGIGVGGRPKDTVYGLYRDGTELRGVYTSKPEVASSACQSMGNQCNFPLLLGNDPLYGGLGGEFTISTASVLNGPLVLRHELGHSIIWVGDEYDGSIYFGVNAANYTKRGQNIGWDHWLPKNNNPPRIERNSVPLLVYPWTMLNESTPWSTNFKVDGTFKSAILRISLSGVPDESHLEISLNSTLATWKTNPDVGIDRWFYDIPMGKLENGTYELKFALKKQGKVGLAQLCSVEVIEYGNTTEFNATEGYVGAFPTAHKQWTTTSFRPTNEDCLMRQVAKSDFCVVCTEGLWLRLLSRVSLIDKVSFYDSAVEGADTEIELSLVALAQFRSPEEAEYLARKGTKEAYLIRWFSHGQEMERWQNATRVDVQCRSVGVIEVEVEFVSSEIRKDAKEYTKDRFRLLLDC